MEKNQLTKGPSGFATRCAFRKRAEPSRYVCDMKKTVIDYLKHCTGADLNDVLNQALSSRDESVTANGIESRLVFCEASRLEDTASPYYEGWRFNPIGPAAPEEDYEGEPFLQSGHCVYCNVEISSHVKKAICPLCGATIGCT